MKIDLAKLDLTPATDAAVVPTSTGFYLPQTRPPKRIAFVGDYPRSEDSRMPFEASHAGAMNALCRDVGINFMSHFQANVLGWHPGKFSRARFQWDNPRVVESTNLLREALIAWDPDLIIGLGELALDWLKDNAGAFDDERGAPFLDRQLGKLTLCTYHPRQIFMQYQFNVIAGADLQKAHRYLSEGFSLGKLPPLELIYQPSFSEVCERLDWMFAAKSYLSVDIESTFDTKLLTCIGLAWHPHKCLVIPWMRGRLPWWKPNEEVEIMKRLARVLETCPLLGQNAVHFDHYVLAWRYKILPNFVDDTMLAHWEVYPEMPKSLGFMNSLYTDNQYWKGVLREARLGKVPVWKEFEYNGRDCCYTLQVAQHIAKELRELPPTCREHYKFNVRTSRCFQYASLRGVRLNTDKASGRRRELEAEVSALNELIQQEVGHPLNVNSPMQMKKFLYEELRLPVRYKMVKNADGEREDRETADFLSLLYLARQFPDMRALQLTAECRKRRKRLSWLNSLTPDARGYVSWAFNVVGTKTGRGAGYKPLSGFGCQPQNVPRTDRDLFEAGENPLGEPCYWLKADLEGADSWTQAAQQAAVGDATLMDDLLAGLKPALVITIAEHFGEHLLSASRDELLPLVKPTKDIIKREEQELGKGRTSYDVNKMVSHGSAYMMKGGMMHANIFSRTQGDLFIPVAECERRQRMIFQRYPFPKVHQFMRSRMNSHGYLDSANGNRRTFYGRKDDATLRDMLAHCPQAHTTYVANLVLHRWFYDLENRVEGTLVPLIEPTNQVHDETDGAFAIARLEQAREVFHRTKDVPLEFWGIKFTIPFEAQYGESWGSAYDEL